VAGGGGGGGGGGAPAGHIWIEPTTKFLSWTWSSYRMIGDSISSTSLFGSEIGR
jgi:hypothetical protein